MMQQRILIVLLALSGVVGISCGGDGGGSKSDPESSAGGSGAGGGVTIDLDAGGIPCGQERCMPEEGSTATACCMDKFASKCGIMASSGLGGMSCVEPPA